MTAVTARRIANAAARREADASRKCNRIMAKAISGASDLHKFCAAEDDFIVDSYDRKVRVSKPTDQEIACTLRGNRVLDSIDLNEQLGPDTITKLIQNGSLVRDAKHNPKSPCNIYWITVRASEVYGIPAVATLSTGVSVALLPAA